MKMFNSLGFLLVVGVLYSNLSVAGDKALERLGQAQQCTSIAERLERLNCFDQLFNTPMVMVRNEDVADDKPQAWHMAFDSTSDNQVLNLVKNGSEESGDAWLTLRARHVEGEQAPVLLMSCINNISRIELALPEAMDAARIRVSIARGPAQSWRSDDVGVLYSSAQGMPAIAMMKAMSKDSRLILRSNAPQVDGLHFDTAQLSQALIPLKTRCGW